MWDISVIPEILLRPFSVNLRLQLPDPVLVSATIAVCYLLGLQKNGKTERSFFLNLASFAQRECHPRCCTYL